MGEGVTIEARMQEALARLTDNEKECLRRRLQQQTAKEMALDLGVSPHAVEKRLKMARAKLGLSSSLEAARLLAAWEGYQRTGPQAADLAASQQERKGRFTKATLAGATAMTVLAATAILLAVSQASSAVNGPARLERNALPPGHVAASEAEIVSITQTTFHHLDANKSGFLEGAETPIRATEEPRPVFRRDANGKVVPTGETIGESGEEGRASFYREADKDGDGRISYPEYHQWSAPNLARSGIPAEWQESMRQWMSPKD